MRWGYVFLVVTALAVAGCQRSSTSASLKSLVPAEAAAAVLGKLDSGGDKRLTAPEMASAPGLAAGFARFDADKDGVVTESELTHRFEAYQNGSNNIAASLMLESKRGPVAEAKVTLTPEECIGEGGPIYEGTTDHGGACSLRAIGSGSLAVPVGYYRVHVVHATLGIDKTLGCELADDAGVDRLVLQVD